MREEKVPGHPKAVKFKVGASQTVLNFKDKGACCLSNSGLRAERQRQQKSDVGFMRSKYRHLQQSGFFGEQLSGGVSCSLHIRGG